MSATERDAAPGELCTCGRRATTVFITGGGEIGYCGVEGSGSDPVLPCPWCGSETPHREPYGDPAMCPDYALKAKVVTADDPLIDAREHANDAYFYADGICKDPDKAIDAIDAAIAELRIARAMLVKRAGS